MDGAGSGDLTRSSAGLLACLLRACAATGLRRDLLEDFFAGIMMGVMVLDGATSVGGGAYTVTASGVSERASTRSRTSCSNGSANGSVAYDSLREGIL
jgi:hypothetical protein